MHNDIVFTINLMKKKNPGSDYYYYTTAAVSGFVGPFLWPTLLLEVAVRSFVGCLLICFVKLRLWWWFNLTGVEWLHYISVVQFGRLEAGPDSKHKWLVRRFTFEQYEENYE